MLAGAWVTCRLYRARRVAASQDTLHLGRRGEEGEKGEGEGKEVYNDKENESIYRSKADIKERKGLT